LLKGKTLAEKKKLLKELELRRQGEHEMKFRMERSELTHDEKLAMEKIESQNHFDEIIKIVNGRNEKIHEKRLKENETQNEFVKEEDN